MEPVYQHVRNASKNSRKISHPEPEISLCLILFEYSVKPWEPGNRGTKEPGNRGTREPGNQGTKGTREPGNNGGVSVNCRVANSPQPYPLFGGRQDSTHPLIQNNNIEFEQYCCFCINGWALSCLPPNSG